MASENEGVKIVAIDSDGVFKYILIKVTTEKGAFNIVRGFAWAAFHDDMYQPASAEIEEMGFETECTGGGRIRHDAAGKKFKVYGYSQAFGRGDHQQAADLLKLSYPDYSFECSNDGY